MYFIGVLVAFFLAFLVFMYQGSLRRENGDGETFSQTLLGSFIGAAIGSILSWLLVLIIIGMIMNKGGLGAD